MAIADDVAKIREAAVRIRNRLQVAEVREQPVDVESLMDTVSMALLKVVAALEDVERRLNRLDADRSYLRRRGYE